jgi:hypothetical protein
MSWCEANHVEFVFGLAKNKRVNRIIGGELHRGQTGIRADGQGGSRVRRFPVSDEEDLVS